MMLHYLSAVLFTAYRSVKVQGLQPQTFPHKINRIWPKYVAPPFITPRPSLDAPLREVFHPVEVVNLIPASGVFFIEISRS